MLFDPVEAAKEAILASSPGETVYTEPKTQDVIYPCYFIALTNVVRRPVLNHRFRIDYSISVRRYPAQHETEPYIAARACADALTDILRILSNGGFAVSARESRAEVQDGTAVYTAAYRICVREPDAVKMQTMEVS